MKQESKKDIVKRLTESLNAQQRSVPQLPAQARAKKISVLGSKTDPKHPFSGYMVGADESAEPDGDYVDEADFNPARRGFLKKAGAAATAAAMPKGLAGAAMKAVTPAVTPAVTTALSTPFAGLTAIDLDDILSLLSSTDTKNPSYLNNAGYDPYDLDNIKDIASDAGLNSWGNSWFVNGNAAQSLLDAIDLGEKNNMSDEDIIDNLKEIVGDLYAAQSLNSTAKSKPTTSTPSGISSLARVAGAQLGSTMKNIGKATANTVLNQPAATAALPAPTASPGMQIPKQKSKVSVSPFNDDHSELDQFVKEEFNRDLTESVNENNPDAAWPEFSQVKTYESQLAEAKQQLAEAESRYVLYFNGKPASHYATREEAEKFADFVKTKYPTVKIEIKNEMHEGVVEGYIFKGGFPFDVDHMPGAVHKQDLDTKKKFTDEDLWLNTVNKLNSSLYDDNSDYISSGNGYRVEIMGKVWAKWDGMKDAGWIETSSLAEGAKVDRMVQHIKSSEKAAGKSAKDAENIAWATANKRGMLDNKNKKKVSEETKISADIRAKNRAVVKKLKGKETDIDEGWKSKLAGAALAGAAALGSGGAQAQAAPAAGVNATGTNAAIVQSLVNPVAQQRFAALHADTTAKLTDPRYDHNPNAMAQHQAAPQQQHAEMLQNIKNIEQWDNPYRIIQMAMNMAGVTPQEVLQNLPKGYKLPTTEPKGTFVPKDLSKLNVKEDITQEDIITKLKAKLGDYLSDLGQQIKKDPALQDKLSAKTPGDQVGPPVKTVTTDDGQTISIHGNEDDGFRISIKNKHTPSKFDSLDEAVMACEMYCAHRRKQALNSDYVDEA